jgi:hypothetical protein
MLVSSELKISPTASFCAQGSYKYLPLAPRAHPNAAGGLAQFAESSEQIVPGPFLGWFSDRL